MLQYNNEKNIVALSHFSIVALNRVTINGVFCLNGELVEIFDVQILILTHPNF